jgi:hypothetical protein
VGKSFEVGMDLIKGSTGKFAGCGTRDFSGGMVNEEANQLATSITGSPDNRNFHNRVSDCKNLMLFKSMTGLDLLKKIKEIREPALFLLQLMQIQGV